MTTIEALKEQIATLEKLLELKDRLIASLQKPEPPEVGYITYRSPHSTWIGHPNTTYGPAIGLTRADQSKFNQS